MQIDREKLLECLREEIDSFPDKPNEYQRGAKVYNEALIKEIESGRFDIKEDTDHADR